MVPHAPLVLEKVASSEVDGSARRIRAAVKALSFPAGSTVVLVSPHGPDPRVYRSTRGNLEGKGISGVEVNPETDSAFAEALADAWVWPSSTERIDHGATVPIALGATKSNRVVVASLTEVTGPDAPDVSTAMSEAQALAIALRKLSERTRIAVVASANTSAGLSPRGPLTELPEAAEEEQRLLAALGRDVGEVEQIAEGLNRLGGSCAAGPLLCLAQLFAGNRATLLAHESPVGVGYLVAQVDV